MSADRLVCYRCGAALTALSLPLSRRDECPECRAQLHVCRMCTHHAPRLSRGCDEDDAPDVRDEETANFCDYFKPRPNAYSNAAQSAAERAKAELDSLFGGSSRPADTPEPSAAERARAELDALFKKK